MKKCVDKLNYKLKEGMKFGFQYEIFEKPSNMNKRPNEIDEVDFTLWNRSVAGVSEFFF